MHDRRSFLSSSAAAAVLLALPRLAASEQSGRSPKVAEMVIRKNPGCMCCNAWATHLEDAGFATRIEELTDPAAFKDEMRIPADLRSCHTGVIGDYVVEGHVPAADVSRLLDTTPEIRGIAAPGMPLGSPGMEMGDRIDRFEVIAFGGGDGEYVFSTHG
ncbi:MAG: DUF411 domain-containing protein [Gemmatimonadota bacterium]